MGLTRRFCDGGRCVELHGVVLTRGAAVDFTASRSFPEAAYRILDPMPWNGLVEPIAAAEVALARLDERLAKSPIREGFLARGHFAEACASLWLDGELVHLEDLVLHDARMDVRAPTAELVRAHAALRARRRIETGAPGWALTAAGLDAMRGRAAAVDEPPRAGRIAIDEDWDEEGGDDAWRKTLDAVDAVVARSAKVLAGETVGRPMREERPSLIYDLDWDEDARLGAWRHVVDDTRALPPTLAAAVALDAWNEIEPLQSDKQLGRLLVADLLRRRGKTRALARLSVGLKAAPQQKRWSRDPVVRLTVALEAIASAAADGLKEHDRLLLAKSMLERRLAGRRSSSRLPALLDLMVEVPVASAEVMAGRLKITPRAALTMARELNLREMTGRARYRAWAI